MVNGTVLSWEALPQDRRPRRPSPPPSGPLATSVTNRATSSTSPQALWRAVADRWKGGSLRAQAMPLFPTGCVAPGKPFPARSRFSWGEVGQRFVAGEMWSPSMEGRGRRSQGRTIVKDIPWASCSSSGIPGGGEAGLPCSGLGPQSTRRIFRSTPIRSLTSGAQARHSE